MKKRPGFSARSDDWLSQVLADQQAGRLDEAEATCRSVLSKDPRNPDALHLTGLLCSYRGRYVDAERFIRKAIQVFPESAVFHANLGCILTDARRLEPAIIALSEALRLGAQLPQVYYNLGLALEQTGEVEHAIEAFNDALRLNPTYDRATLALKRCLVRVSESSGVLPTASNTEQASAKSSLERAQSLYQDGKFDDAMRWLQHAISLRPAFPDAHYALGRIHLAKKQPIEALLAFDKTIALRPELADGHAQRGAALVVLKRYEEAAASCREALRLDHEHAAALSELGLATFRLGDPNQAADLLKRSLGIRPNDAATINNFGAVMHDLGDFIEALASYRRALTLNSSLAQAHHNLGQALLTLGNFEEGFTEHEWRWKCDDIPRRSFTHPQWDGRPLPATARLLVHAEQGFGDTIQFIRYLTLIAAMMPAKIIVELPTPLQRLIRQSMPDVHVIAQGHDTLPEFDVHCPMMSLPHVFRTTVQSAPAAAPYLHARVVEESPPRLAEDRRLKVGLVWAGSKGHIRDVVRSIPVQLLKPFAELDQVEWHSLTRPAKPDEAAAPDWLIGHAEEIRDFADTSRLLSQLDLLISVDTAVAHLAGALGIACWIMLPFVPDWRWLLHRDDSIWYPTVRLFRQPQLNNWPAVIAAVARELLEKATRFNAQR